MDIKKQRVLITRPVHQAESFGKKLKSLGAEPIPFPMIEISATSDTSALDRALSQLTHYDWLILTSANGVEAVWSRLEDLAIKGLPSTLGTAAVGPKTAEAMRKHGVEPDFVPDEYVGEAILPGLGCLRDRLVLLPSADIAREALPDAISAADGIAHVIPAYRTVPAMANPEGLSALNEGVDLITFTSPSSVRNFVTLTQEADLDPSCLPGKPLCAYIGPITAKAAKALKMPIDILATDYTVDGLIQAVLDYQPPINQAAKSEPIN